MGALCRDHGFPGRNRAARAHRGYSAAKAGVVALADVLREETMPYEMGVTSACPGPVPTRIDETTRAAGSSRPDRNLQPSDAPRVLSASVVAQGIVDAVKNNIPTGSRTATSGQERRDGSKS
ncbi:SDR family NAD(P)-dependent oxidoreductase [Sphingobium sp. SCG-1]|uniref:SDR family NAD(P)-dependent oxidoreductase n=1 Tax=Sphingobium sp. SCG-1 TaxID=2072936 RepID=UPI001670C04E